ncbi:MAG: hypothetical protein K2H29_08655 [Oscillospiraceae bacterium]|nr:hypothetical protein [Oscillospiraceae bacterium]
MIIQVNIDDNEIDNFSTDAQTTLKKQMEKYALDIIKEANLIEETRREDGASTEITSNTILLAVRKSKIDHNKKKNKGLLISKIVSTLSVLLTGFFFDSEGYQNNLIKLISFVSFLIIACVSTVLQFVLEDKE